MNTLKPEMKFTERELEVLQLLSLGKLNKEIACVLNITIDTVKKHNKKIFKKTGFSRRVQVASFFIDNIRVC